MSSLTFPMRFRWKYIGELIFIWYTVYLLNFFAVLVVSYWFTVEILDYLELEVFIFKKYFLSRDLILFKVFTEHGTCEFSKISAPYTLWNTYWMNYWNMIPPSVRPTSKTEDNFRESNVSINLWVNIFDIKEYLAAYINVD